MLGPVQHGACYIPLHQGYLQLCIAMQMEGANLYDVFQKIGRGDFQPLPADRFSPAMRGAVQQLLAQDPNTRPSAEQCYQQVLLMQQQLEKLGAVPGQLAQPQQQAAQLQRQLQPSTSARQKQVRTGMRLASGHSSVFRSTPAHVWC
jgi:hypothetical protein